MSNQNEQKTYCNGVSAKQITFQSGATWKHKRGGKGEAAWEKWVSDELKAWVTWWKANPSVVHYGSNATYRGTMKATPDQAMREIEMRQNAPHEPRRTKGAD